MKLIRSSLPALCVAGIVAVQGLAQNCPPFLPNCTSPGLPGTIGPGDFNVVLIVLDDLGCDKLRMYQQTPSTDPCDPALPAGSGSTQWEELPATPNLDALRQSGVLFTNCYVNPMCSPTRSMVLTGRHAFRTGLWNQIDDNQAPDACSLAPKYRLADQNVFLSEYLAADASYGGVAQNPGYVRGAFGKWHLCATGYRNITHPITNGFQYFAGMLGNPADHFAWTRWVSRFNATTFQEEVVDPGTTSNVWTGTSARADAEQWLAGVGTAPFFAYVGFSPPHNPVQVPPLTDMGMPMVDAETSSRLRAAALRTNCNYLQPSFAPPAPPTLCATMPTATCAPAVTTCATPAGIMHEQRAYYRLVYRAAIEAVDYEIGKLRALLPPDTMIVVIGDNGTADEHMQTSLSAGTCSNNSPAPYPPNHGKRFVNQLGTRVPLIVSGPLACAGGTCTAVVNGTDLFATIAAMAGAQPPPASIAQDSQNFLPLVRNPTAQGTRRFAFSEWAGNIDCSLVVAPCGTPGTTGVHSRALTDGLHRYIRRRSSAPLPPPACGPGFAQEEFYGLAADPNELNNLLLTPGYSHPVLDAMRQTMDCLGGP